ncbi:MAG: PrsW family intrarane metalloprotease [Firmicutes bacterium]|nr:PrsW family intrarane metalloprotease [Bacillota bacterium]
MLSEPLIIAVAPGIALALIAYLTDWHDREPVRLLLMLFAIGFIAVIPTAIIEQTLLVFNPFTGLLSIAFIAFLVAGLTEELVKRKVVTRFALYRPEFNEKLDGIIYSVFVALGFATAENIEYVVFAFASNPYVGIYRGVVSVPAHMLFAITMGYYISLSKFSTEQGLKSAYLRKALTVPALLHGIFDFILMSQMDIVLLAFIPFILYLWVANMKKLNSYYKDSKNNHHLR